MHFSTGVFSTWFVVDISFTCKSTGKAAVVRVTTAMLAEACSKIGSAVIVRIRPRGCVSVCRFPYACRCPCNSTKAIFAGVKLSP